MKILREADLAPVVEVAKKHGISDQTIYLWRKRFGELEAVDVKRLRRRAAAPRPLAEDARRPRAMIGTVLAKPSLAELT